MIADDLPAARKALIENDLGTLDGLQGEMNSARGRFERALAIDPRCDAARQNLATLDTLATDELAQAGAGGPPTLPEPARPSLGPKIAILSLLFNWPSTGGGTVHTAEAAKFLHRAGYDVRHIYAQFAEWGVGNVTQPLAVPAEQLRFDAVQWTAPEIQRRFREALDRFVPNYVIITDSWNFKPLLAEAVRGYRYFLRLAALECLCPLNNVRLLVDDRGHPSACPRHQLASPHQCGDCVVRRQHQSGSLHQAERALSGYGTPAYDQKLRQAFAEAEGILAVNPLIAAMVGPFSSAVHVVPSGFDSNRFPWPWPEAPRQGGKTTLFFAGLVEEYMKGFHVLHAACEKLWARRQDFELVVTANASPHAGPFTRFIGWQTQEDLPKRIREADILVFPTIAEEALGRSAVEAMGVGRPVVASRIGGLQFTVADEATGLLFEPGDVDDLIAKIETLLDDPPLQKRMGNAARRRFEEHFTWDAIIEKHYRRLLVSTISNLPGH